MAGGLKKSNIKKKSQRAELMAEEKRIEQEKEQAKKDAAIRKRITTRMQLIQCSHCMD